MDKSVDELMAEGLSQLQRIRSHTLLINFDMKYIDADCLRAEIEKRLKNTRDYMNGAGMKYKGPKHFKAQGKESAYDALLNIIDSLQQEQPEVDLENYISNKLRELGADLINHKPYSFNRGLNVGKTKAYEDILGRLNTRKEE